MFNLYELFRKYNIEHKVSWEAFKLENGLIVKIEPESDPLYPFNVGDIFNFISYSTYKSGHPLYIQNISDQVREEFQPRIKRLGVNSQPEYDLYSSKIIKKIDLIKVIDLKDKDFNFSLLNFTLIGIPMFAEILVFMMQEIQRSLTNK